MLIIAILCILGFLVTGYLIYMHYTGAHSICDINETFACSVVNTSSYSKFMGLPISLLGFFSYLAIFVLAIRVMMKKTMKKHFKKTHLVDFIFFISLFGTLFQFYLLYIETFLLEAFCIFCIMSEILITLIFLLTLVYIVHVRKI